MKLRSLIAIFSFLAAFGLSVFLVRPFSTKTNCFEINPAQKPTAVVRPQNDLTVRMRDFLEADRQTGREWSADFSKFHANDDTLKAELSATSNLIRKMKKVKCEDFPSDFCEAWVAHVAAWKEKEIFLESVVVKRSYSQTEESKLSNEISRTYDKMVDAARQYGVEFEY